MGVIFENIEFCIFGIVGIVGAGRGIARCRYEAIPKMQNSIFSKITPTVPPKPNQTTPTHILHDREMRVPTHHNIDTRASDVRVQEPTRLRPPVIKKSIPIRNKPPQPP